MPSTSCEELLHYVVHNPGVGWATHLVVPGAFENYLRMFNAGNCHGPFNPEAAAVTERVLNAQYGYQKR